MSFSPKTGAVSHLERTIPDAIAAKLDFATFAAIDYLPSTLGDRVYPLPSHIIGKKRVGMINQLFEARYSGYKKFNSESTFIAGPVVSEEVKQPSSDPLEPVFQKPACKQNFKSRPCTPESVAFQNFSNKDDRPFTAMAFRATEYRVVQLHVQQGSSWQIDLPNQRRSDRFPDLFATPTYLSCLRTWPRS